MSQDSAGQTSGKTPSDIVNIAKDAYNQMFTSIFVGTLFVLILGFLDWLPFLWRTYVHPIPGGPAPEVPLIATVLLSGALGALFSALTRLYGFEDEPYPVVPGSTIGSGCTGLMG